MKKFALISILAIAASLVVGTASMVAQTVIIRDNVPMQTAHTVIIRDVKPAQTAYTVIIRDSIANSDATATA